MKQKIGSTKITIPVTRTEVTEHANGAKSWREVPNGTKTGVVELWIDVDALLADLGRRAVKSRGKRAQLASGNIVVKASNVTHDKEVK